MVTCTVCNNSTMQEDIPPGQSVPCWFCGNPLPVQAAQPAAVVPPSSYKQCPACHAQVMEGAFGCPECGHSFQSTAAETPVIPGEYDLLLTEGFEDTPAPAAVVQDPPVWGSPQTPAYGQDPVPVQMAEVYLPPGFSPPPAPPLPAAKSSPRNFFLLGAFFGVLIMGVLIAYWAGETIAPLLRGLWQQLADASGKDKKPLEPKTTTMPTTTTTPVTPTPTPSGTTTTVPPIVPPKKTTTVPPIVPPIVPPKKTTPEPVIPPLAERPFKSPKFMVSAIRDDLLALPAASQKRQRYFTLVHLHNNPAVSLADLENYRLALLEMLNYLHGSAVSLKAADTERLIFRLDLKQMGWEEDESWGEILKSYPYGLLLKAPKVRDKELVKSAAQIWKKTELLPWVHADWFIATASRDPLRSTLAAKSAALGRLPALVATMTSRYLQPVTLATATCELGLNDVETVQKVLLMNEHLLKLGKLKALAEGMAISRQAWASSSPTGRSLFQEVASELSLGVPWQQL